VPNHVGRTRHSTYPSGEFRELPDDLLIEVGQHTLNAAQLVFFQGEDESRLKPLEHANVEVLRRLAGQNQARANMAAHTGKLVEHLRADRLLVIRNYSVGLINEVEREPPCLLDQIIVPVPQSQDVMTEILRAGAQKMLADMIQAEVEVCGTNRVAARWFAMATCPSGKSRPGWGRCR